MFPMACELIFVAILVFNLIAGTVQFEKDATSLDTHSRRQNNNTDQSCEIPAYLPKSVYKILNQSMYKPGDYVQQYGILETICDPGYVLPPLTQKTSLCLKGNWNNLPPPCLRSCPSLMSTTSMTVKCRYNNTSLSNCINPVDGTTVFISCNKFYESDGIRDNPSRVCFRGRWSFILPECYPTCGKKNHKERINVIHGANSTFILDYHPWHVGIYYTKPEKFLCGGSLITRNIILSAANCFTDDNGMVMPSDIYLIAAGKYYYQYQDDRDKFAQYSKVREIHVPERYRGIVGYYGFNIAAVVLETSFILNVGVQPVCIDLSDQNNNPNIIINHNGTFGGRGYNQEGEFTSDVLKELVIVYYIPYVECYSEVPFNFRRYITYDKICGNVLRQDDNFTSGSGLVFNRNDHYYLTALSSLASEPHQYYLCVLPNFPMHGNYSLLGSTDKPRYYVNVSDVLLLSCDNGYEANPPGAIEFLCVSKGQWIPAVGSCTRKRIDDEVGTCTTPDKHIGNCVLIRECQSMQDFLEQPTTINEIPRTLKNYQCSIERNSLKVCCPEKPITIKVPCGNGEKPPIPVISQTPDVTSAVTLNVGPPRENFFGAPILFSNVYSANQIYRLEVDRKPNDIDDGLDHITIH